MALTCGLATMASAEVQVEGGPAAVRVTTHQDTIADVLSAFAAAYNIKYRTEIPLDAAANTTYSGSFRQEISHLLDGYNYVVENHADATEIHIFGRRGAAAIAPKAPPEKGIIARWR